ncbi:DUF2690 domain-containing protein [Streptomyces sp. NPDC046727]|uniref:XRE family transcriptional regulator n=1 Tax=Streptomyces sp. NPDC046727 TaxID=3155373 RepID=UPI0033C852F5
MPRWKALPDDLDPQIKEFTGQLRQLVDRSGLSVAALADRTGYSPTSWERYLGGRLLAPKGAVIALAEATGASPVHLTTLWELAERAWSRAEMRHDHTISAISIAEARAALGTVGTPTEPVGGASTGKPDGTAGGKAGGKTGGSARGSAGGSARGAAGGSVGGKTGGAAGGLAAGSAGGNIGGSARGAADGTAGAADGTAGSADGTAGSADGTAGSVDGLAAGSAGGKTGWAADRKGSGKNGGEEAGRGGGNGFGAAVVPGVAGPAGVSPTFPAQPADAVPGGADTPGRNSWGLAGYRGPSEKSARPGTRPPARPDGSARTPEGPGTRPQARPDGSARTPSDPPRTPEGPGTPGPSGGQPAVAPRPAPATEWSPRRQQLTMFFAGLFGVLVLIAGVFFFTHPGGDGHKNEGTAKSPAPSARTRTSLPPGVKCAGSACTGKDAEAMGCARDLVTTARTVALGTTTLEVRYSRACGTAWGRITSGAPGDSVRLTAGKVRQSGDITVAGDTIAYTPMIAVKDPGEARACATLASGRTGCTK